MLMKVSDLDGRALNWAVASVLWGKSRPAGNWHCFDTGDPDEPQVIVRELPKAIQDDEYNPSGNWAHGGPLIEEWMFSISYATAPSMGRHMWSAKYGRENTGLPRCLSPLVAVMRELVYLRKGHEIEIPDELCEVAK